MAEEEVIHKGPKYFPTLYELACQAYNPSEEPTVGRFKSFGECLWNVPPIM